MFNFEKANKDAEKTLSTPLVGAVILGPSGGGKSTVMGTFGVKTLYLYANAESHGPAAARSKGGKDVYPICISKTDSGEDITDPDQVYDQLLAILNSADSIKGLGIGAIVFDGLTELEGIVRGTKRWAKLCQTAKGDHNTYAETGACITMMRPVLAALQKLQRDLGVHFAVSCILSVKDISTAGDILEASAKLQGYELADSLIPQFSEVLVIGRMTRANEVKHKFQFLTEITKSSKEKTGAIKKCFNFGTRITGVDVDKLPPIADPDLSKIVEIKKQYAKK